VYETADDLADLQRLLDESAAAAGGHLHSIFDEERRVSAEQLVGLLVGVNVLDVATVTAHGEPRVAPVDGLFYRGHWYFGSSPESARFRHLRQRPAVSACHTRGEEFAVIVHGRAAEIDIEDAANAAFVDFLYGIYIPRYGPDWPEFMSGCPYAVIDATRMFVRAASSG
jgi:nitroimidazol reductase NimA-like FMN-containing flavoprotein (pyridoxamine 5'-phosphate oxidase superfamily)